MGKMKVVSLPAKANPRRLPTLKFKGLLPPPAVEVGPDVGSRPLRMSVDNGRGIVYDHDDGDNEW